MKKLLLIIACLAILIIGWWLIKGAAFKAVILTSGFAGGYVVRWIQVALKAETSES